MEIVFRLLWALLYGCFRVTRAVALPLAKAIAHSAYGKPVVSSAPVSTGTTLPIRPLPVAAPVVAPPAVASVAVDPGGLTAVKPTSPAGSVTQSHSQPRELSLEGSDRIRTLELVNRDVLMGVLWLYLYPGDRKVRRVFKVQNPGLARALGFKRYYYEDVPYAPEAGVSAIDKVMDDFFDHVRSQLNRSKAPDLARGQRAVPKEVAPAVRPPEKVVEPVAPKVAPVVEASTPSPVRQAPEKVQKAAGSKGVNMQVQGVPTVGVVTHMGMTRKHGRTGPYETFGLTLNDGKIEQPFFGVEIQRLVEDLGVETGEKIQVVYMGKQEVPGHEGGRAYQKNLYKITRMSAP